MEHYDGYRKGTSYEIEDEFPKIKGKNPNTYVHGVNLEIQLPAIDSPETITSWQTLCGRVFVDSYHGVRLSRASEGWEITGNKVTCPTCKGIVERGGRNSRKE